MQVEIDTLIKLKYGSPLDPKLIPTEIVESAVSTLAGATAEAMSDELKRQVLWILLRQPRNKNKTDEFLYKALIEYENRR